MLICALLCLPTDCANLLSGDHIFASHYNNLTKIKICLYTEISRNSNGINFEFSNNKIVILKDRIFEQLERKQELHSVYNKKLNVKNI